METIIITFENNDKKEYPKGVKLSTIINDVKNNYEYDIICGKFRNQIINYDDSIVKSGNLILYDINTKVGNRIYEKGLYVLFSICAKEILGKNTTIKLRHSIDKGIFCEIKNDKLDSVTLKAIKTLMKEKVNKSIPFTKLETSKEEAIEYFKNIKREDKVKTLSYDNSRFVTLYKIEENYNYILGNLPFDTSILKYFDLTLIENKGVVLRFPSMYDNGKVIKYTHHTNYFNSLEEYNIWANILNIGNFGELNDAIINNNAGEIIQMAEIVQNYKLLDIAEEVATKKDEIKVVLLSGPSSSGKTTTAKKLSLYLKSLGLKPYQLSLDDYFLNREDTPLDENGNPDFESIRAIDIKLFNNQIEKILKGIEVVTPTFDFVSGKKLFKNKLKMSENGILVIEGLHALNDEILSNINKKNKYKIYISPLAFMNVDDDNRINMTDIRLLRRIVRDNRVRGYSPEHTLKWWDNVRLGEEKYVFPFQDSANVIFNSYLVYELGVLKQYVEPLLHSIKEDSEEYVTALHLLEMLKFVLPIPSDNIPDISILREFIGESYFE